MGLDSLDSRVVVHRSGQFSTEKLEIYLAKRSSEVLVDYIYGPQQICVQMSTTQVTCWM